MARAVLKGGAAPASAQGRAAFYPSEAPLAIAAPAHEQVLAAFLSGRGPRTLRACSRDLAAAGLAKPVSASWSGPGKGAASGTFSRVSEGSRFAVTPGS